LTRGIGIKEKWLKEKTVFMAIATFNMDQVKGYVKFSEAGNNVRIDIRLSNMEPDSTHAIHIHEYGDVRGGCKSTGGHWNPTNTTHGSYLVPSRPRHLGDLINNLETDERGNFSFSYVESGYEISELYGRTIVIHTLADDLGLQGVQGRHEIIPYSCFSRNGLAALCRQRGYFGDEVDDISFTELLNKLNTQSLKTGNAGGRMACAIIGRINESF